jgi:hypothetical protein
VVTARTTGLDTQKRSDGDRIGLMCCVRISEQTATLTLHDINRSVLYNRSGVFTARYALRPYIKQITFRL